MQSGVPQSTNDVEKESQRTAFVRLTTGLTKRCSVLKEACDGSSFTIELEKRVASVSARHVWFEGSESSYDSSCVVCFAGGFLLTCIQCHRLFHEECSSMPRPKSSSNNVPNFTCRDCFFMLYTARTGMENRTIARNSLLLINEVKKFSTYAYRELRWDALFRSNKSSVYCYCGGPGRFYNQMVQCLRCLQWFHRVCLHSLPFEREILPWDCFWYFKCSHCNGSYGEVIRQLPVQWIEILHVALMNLAGGKSRFCWVKTEIMPWLEKNWNKFRPARKVTLTVMTEEKLLTYLQSDPVRFQCAQEVGGSRKEWRSRCFYSGPIRQDLNSVWPASLPISQERLNDIAFERAAPDDLPLLILHPKTKLPSINAFDNIYGSREKYKAMELRLDASRIGNYDRLEKTRIAEYRPDEDRNTWLSFPDPASLVGRRHQIPNSPKKRRSTSERNEISPKKQKSIERVKIVDVTATKVAGQTESGMTEKLQPPVKMKFKLVAVKRKHSSDGANSPPGSSKKTFVIESSSSDNLVVEAKRPSKSMEVGRSSEKSMEVRRSSEKSLEVRRRSSEKSLEVRRSSEKSMEVRRSSEKSMEVGRSSEKSLEVRRSSEEPVEVGRHSEKSMEVKQRCEKSMEVEPPSEKSMEVRQSSEKSMEMRQSSEKSMEVPRHSEESMEVKQRCEKSMEVERSSEKPGEVAKRTVLNAVETQRPSQNAVEAKPTSENHEDAERSSENLAEANSPSDNAADAERSSENPAKVREPFDKLGESRRPSKKSAESRRLHENPPVEVKTAPSQNPVKTRRSSFEKVALNEKPSLTHKVLLTTDQLFVKAQNQDKLLSSQKFSVKEDKLFASSEMLSGTENKFSISQKLLEKDEKLSLSEKLSAYKGNLLKRRRVTENVSSEKHLLQKKSMPRNYSEMEQVDFSEFCEELSLKSWPSSFNNDAIQDSKGNNRKPANLRPRSQFLPKTSRRVARKSGRPGPLREDSPPPPKVTVRPCSVSLDNIYNWYEITGDEPPRTCSSGACVLHNIPVSPAGRPSKFQPFLYRWEVDPRLRISHAKLRRQGLPSIDTPGTPKEIPNPKKKKESESDDAIAAVIARRRQVVKRKQPVSNMAKKTRSSITRVDDEQNNEFGDLLLLWNHKLVRVDRV